MGRVRGGERHLKRILSAPPSVHNALSQRNSIVPFRYPAKHGETTGRSSGLVLCFGLAAGGDSLPEEKSLTYTKDGKMLLPDFRRWVFLSSGFGTTYTAAGNPDSGNLVFHNVFVNPGATTNSSNRDLAG